MNTDLSSYQEVPVMKLNFYMMGQDTINRAILADISDNVDHMNDEFEGYIRFSIQSLVVEPNHAYLPDIHHQYAINNTEAIDQMLMPIETSGSVNIFLFDTYIQEGAPGALMGFTPILSQKHKLYREITPEFDRIFMAYHGLINKTTLIHEMGHFLGLQHPWEMHKFDIALMGLQKREDQERNHMGYGEFVDSFTTEQLDRMTDFALRFRGYLLERIEYASTP